MAKLSMIARETKRSRTIKKFQKVRVELKNIVKKGKDFAERMAAQVKLQKLPRDASPTRLIKRCTSCGRDHGVYRKFGLCRMCLRKALMNGYIPGGRKASW
jgi:small subunit ribosomal protein S14